MNKKIIITGFEPFGTDKINPSWEMIRDFKSDKNEIIKMCLPVVFGKASEILIEKIKEEKPDVVVMFGQAGGRKKITPERVAINFRDCTIKDNEGNKPQDKYIIKNAPAAYFSTLPIKKICRMLKNNFIPSGISNSAGTYVCNDLMYNILNYIDTENLKIKAGFIHVPYIREQVFNSENFFMELDILKKAAVLIADSF